MESSGKVIDGSGLLSKREARTSISGHAEIVRSVLSGNYSDFELIVHEFESPIFRHLLRLTANHEDAEDLTQECFARVFTKLGAYDVSRPLAPWIYRIAANLALSHLRARRPTVALEEMGRAEPEAPAKDQFALADEQLTQVRAAMKDLAPDARAVLELFYDEDLRIEEIAEILDRKPGAIKMALHRARTRLRELVFGSARAAAGRSGK